jgi:Fic family protein
MYAPRFTITNNILKSIGKVEAAKEVIENAPLVPDFIKDFKSDAIVRTVYHGTQIEGNDLTLLQTKQVLEGESVIARDRDIQEVINYRNVVSLLDELAAKRVGYDIESLLDVHRATVDKIVEPARAGVLRTTQVVIKEQGTGKVIFTPPPAVEVPYLISDFLSWLNSPESADM